jgi:hypothetical protein
VDLETGDVWAPDPSRGWAWRRPRLPALSRGIHILCVAARSAMPTPVPQQSVGTKRPNWRMLKRTALLGALRLLKDPTFYPSDPQTGIRWAQELAEKALGVAK